MKTSKQSLWLFMALALLAACSTPQPGAMDNAVEKVVAEGNPVDFSGSWELDYRRSDNLRDRVRRIYRDLLRQAERQARRMVKDPRREFGRDLSASGMAMEASRMASDSIAAITPLARLADYITTSQVLEIEQSETDITVEREDTFALSCHFQADSPLPVTAELGSELCGWNDHQLVFIVALPDNTRIKHRLTLAPDGQQLHIATTVSRSRDRTFTLNRVYYRFDPLPPGYQCEYTLSRGNVCSRSGS